MSNTSSPGALPPAVGTNPWAEVLSHDRTIRYRRSGSGATIVLMLPPELAPLGAELTRVLSNGFRLIVPDLPLTEHPLECLAEFLEGLGCCSVTLIAASPLSIAAIELALRDPDQVSRLVLLPDGDAIDGASEDSIVATFGDARVPALLVRPSLDAERAAQIIAEFLSVGPTKAS